MKASKPHGVEKLKRSSYDDALLKIERIPDIIGPNAPSSNENRPENWHVQVTCLLKSGASFHMVLSYFPFLTAQQLQVFRSIDSNSVKGFPKDPKEATSRVWKIYDFFSIYFSIGVTKFLGIGY